MASRQVQAIVAALGRSVTRVTRALAFNVTAELIERTPVNTGWARANWVPAVGAPHQGVVGAPQAVTTSDQAAGQAAVAAYDAAKGGSVFVSNHVPYINRLNEGHSQQAPAGFVQQAIQKAVSDTERDFAKLGEE